VVAVRLASVQTIHELVVAFRDGDRALQNAIVEAAAPYLIQFHEFADHQAIESVRQNDPDLIREGLIALAIENARFDYRDSLVILSLLCHSARKLGFNDDDPVRESLNLARLPWSPYLVEWIERDEFQRSIQMMGFAEGENEGGFTYDPVNPF
jgi:hypothetical protein